MIPLLSLLFFITSIQGCLKVHYSTCECSAFAMTSAVTHAYGNDELGYYGDYRFFAMMTPYMKKEGCSITMSCETPGYQLVVFDVKGGHEFGAYAAEGMCQLESQTWLVNVDDEFREFKRLFGICVNYNIAVKNLTDRSNECPCVYELLDNTNADKFIAYDKGYRYNQKHMNLSKPIITYDMGCMRSFRCEPSDDGVAVFLQVYTPEYGFETPEITDFECSSYQMFWNYTTVDGPKFAPYMFLTCARLIPRHETEPYFCGECLNAQPEQVDVYLMKNWAIIPDLSRDKCIYTISCRELYNVVTPGFPLAMVVHGQCSKDTGVWEISTSNDFFKTSKSVNLFEFGCVYKGQ